MAHQGTFHDVQSIRVTGLPHAPFGMARPDCGQPVLDRQCLLVRHRVGGRRVAIGRSFVVDGGECRVAFEARICLKRSQGHADTCASEHDPAPVPRVGLEPTGNGGEIEDCSASAGVSEGTVPPGVTRDLREVIEAWDELPHHVRAAVLLLVRV